MAVLHGGACQCMPLWNWVGARAVHRTAHTCSGMRAHACGLLPVLRAIHACVADETAGALPCAAMRRVFTRCVPIGITFLLPVIVQSNLLIHACIRTCCVRRVSTQSLHILLVSSTASDLVRLLKRLDRTVV